MGTVFWIETRKELEKGNKMKRTLLILIGALQIILGIAFTFAPDLILSSMGQSVPPSDLHYQLGMLASRFLVIGVAFIIISNNIEKHRFWIRAMALIQVLDLAFGIYYTSIGVVGLKQSGIPMFDAIWIIAACVWITQRPKLNIQNQLGA